MGLELYGTATCPHTAELRGQLESDNQAFVEYDVEADAVARARLARLMNPPLSVPVLVEDGHVAMVGWQGRSCYIGEA